MESSCHQLMGDKVFSGAGEEKEEFNGNGISKQILNLNIKDIEGKMGQLRKNSELLDERSVKLMKYAEKSLDATILLSETFKRKSEGQVLGIRNYVGCFFLFLIFMFYNLYCLKNHF